MQKMLFQDGMGKILTSGEVDKLSLWEIDERALHVYDNEEIETVTITGGTGGSLYSRKNREPV